MYLREVGASVTVVGIYVGEEMPARPVFRLTQVKAAKRLGPIIPTTQ
jgi:hypothetical protein